MFRPQVTKQVTTPVPQIVQVLEAKLSHISRAPLNESYHISSPSLGSQAVIMLRVLEQTQVSKASDACTLCIGQQ